MRRSGSDNNEEKSVAIKMLSGDQDSNQSFPVSAQPGPGPTGQTCCVEQPFPSLVLWRRPEWQGGALLTVRKSFGADCASRVGTKDAVAY